MRNNQTHFGNTSCVLGEFDVIEWFEPSLWHYRAIPTQHVALGKRTRIAFTTMRISQLYFVHHIRTCCNIATSGARILNVILKETAQHARVECTISESLCHFNCRLTFACFIFLNNVL